MTETLTLKTSPWRQLGLLLVSAAFVAIGVMMVRDGEWVGWLCIGFFGLGVFVGLVNLVPGGSSLQLTPEGMTIRSLFRSWSVAWHDVDGFFQITVARRSMVGWNYVPGFTAQAVGRKLSSGLAGAESALPDTYGRSADALAALLNRWREKYAGDRQVVPDEPTAR